MHLLGRYIHLTNHLHTGNSLHEALDACQNQSPFIGSTEQIPSTLPTINSIKRA